MAYESTNPTVRATASRRVVLQTRALIVDAYREVNSKKLFWVTLILSLMVVGVFACVGINERGVKILTWEIPGLWNTNLIPADQFYSFMFTQFAIPWWLGFFATILALVSVCSLFPDLLGGGSIDLYLARPISRLRLFFTKYLLGLTFCAMQVGVFSIASFLIMGIRGGSWEWGIFPAVPLVTLYFSYLFCICVLVGVVTRSSLAALLTTLLFWGFLFALNTTDAGLLAFKVFTEERVIAQKRVVDFNKDVIQRNSALAPEQQSDVSGFQFQLDKQQESLVKLEKDAADVRWWHNLVIGIKWPMPKTGETVALMARWLVDPTPFANVRDTQREQWRPKDGGDDEDEEGADAVEMGDPQVEQRLEQELTTRSAAVLIGTSLMFEIAVLSLASWIFVRRDF